MTVCCHVESCHAKTPNNGGNTQYNGGNTQYDGQLTKVVNQLSEIHGVFQKIVEGHLTLHKCHNDDRMSKLEEKVDEIHALLHKFIPSVGGDGQSGQRQEGAEQEDNFNPHNVDCQDNGGVKVVENFEFVIDKQGGIGTSCDKEAKVASPIVVSSSFVAASEKELPEPKRTVKEKSKKKNFYVQKRKAIVP